MLAEDAFENMLEINLEVEPDAVSLFASKDPRVILELFEARYGMRVTPGATLLFLDEVQAAPELLAGLRYFYEGMPELHVVAAGSLLDFALRDRSFSMPEGRIEYLHLGPMTFEEFWRALGREQLVRFLADWTVEAEISEAIHNELPRLLRRFLIVGGMPASVEAFVSSGAGDECERIKQGILSI
jgi:predicted AAA+ superfamily ATPase